MLFPGNWESIKTEISYSNVLQRDSVMFAKKLGSNMEQYAKDKEEEVRISEFLLVYDYFQQAGALRHILDLTTGS